MCRTSDGSEQFRSRWYAKLDGYVRFRFHCFATFDCFIFNIWWFPLISLWPTFLIWMLSNISFWPAVYLNFVKFVLADLLKLTVLWNFVLTEFFIRWLWDCSYSWLYFMQGFVIFLFSSTFVMQWFPSMLIVLHYALLS